MVQVPDEMLETIDQDRRLVNDWAGLSNDEKQLMIDNYQPNQPYDNKLMRSQTLGDFIGTYNRAVKPPEPEWFSEKEGRHIKPHKREVPPEERPRGSPKQLVDVEEELVIPTGGMKLNELKYFVVEYDKLSEDKKREILKRVDSDTIQLIKDFQPKAKFKNSWRIINSMVEDWLQAHKEGALKEKGPLRNLFTPEELEDIKGLKTLGEEFKPSSLLNLLEEWEDLIKLTGSSLDSLDNATTLPILIRIANEMGKKTISDKSLIDENFIYGDFEKSLDDLFHSSYGLQNDVAAANLEEFKSNFDSVEFENIFLDSSHEANKGLIQWGVLQDLVHKRHRIFFSPKKKTVGGREQLSRWDAKNQRERKTTLLEIRDEKTPRAATLGQTVGEDYPAWQLQLQTYRGRTSSSKSYKIPLYLVVHPDKISDNFADILENVIISRGDWFITCGKGVIIYWSEQQKERYYIFDNDSKAIIKVHTDDLRHSKQSDDLRNKLNNIKNSPRSGEKWNDILEVMEKLLGISDKLEDKEDKEYSKTIIEELIKRYESKFVGEPGVRTTSHSYTQDVNKLVLFNRKLFESFLSSIIEEIKSKPFTAWRTEPTGEREYTPMITESIDVPNEWYVYVLKNLFNKFDSLEEFVKHSSPIFNDEVWHKYQYSVSQIFVYTLYEGDDGKTYSGGNWNYDGLPKEKNPSINFEKILFNEFASQLQLWIAQNSKWELSEE